MVYLKQLNITAYFERISSERSKKGSYLFCSLLDAQKVKSFVNLNEQLLLKAIKMSSKQFSKALQNCNRKIYLFLANYKQIMQIHSRTFSNYISVNLSLHFALLFTETLIRESNYSYAKVILKQTEEYLQIQDCDPMLLSICLNNLALLYCRNAKYKKGLLVALKGIGIVQEHLDRLHTMKMKKRTIEDGVVFVNLLLVGKRSIEKLLARRLPDKENYYHLLKVINKVGYYFSVKYFGQESLFTSKFQFNESTIDLPVYDSVDSSEKDQRNGFQMHVAQQLAHIYDILKNLKLQPEVYYIRQNVIIGDKKQEDSEIQLDPVLQFPSIEEDMNVSYVETIIIDDWNTQLSILKSNGNAEDKEYNFIGYLKFSFTKSRKVVTKIISEEYMRKIINVININDVLPYQIELKWMPNQQFIKRIFIHYLSVNSDGELSIFPRAKSITQPFQMKFCGEKSIILLYHIQFRKFRLAICPIGSSETIYLQINFKHKHISEMVKIIQSQNLFIKNQQKRYNSSKEYGQKQYQFAQNKHIQILTDDFRSKIRRIIQLFEQFLDQQQQNRLQDISSFISYQQNYIYYQYTEFDHKIGRFHLVKYRSNSNLIQVSVKNTYKTYSCTGLKMAKGVGMYSPQQFHKDFSLVLKQSRKYLGALSQIILQKFTLKEYENPLTEEEQDLYEENAIVEIPILSKTYLRRFIRFQSYFIPVTLQVITINNEKPVGIRVSAYEPIKSNNSGLFIHITPEFWQRPQTKAAQESDQSINDKVKRVVKDYNFQKCYFITDWMHQQGFELIFSRLSIVNRALEIDNTHGRFIVLEDLFPK